MLSHTLIHSLSLSFSVSWIVGGSGAVKPTGPLATLQRSQHSSCDGDEDIQENDAICLLCRLAFRFVENIIKIECWCKKTVVAHEAWASNTSVINCNKCGQSYNHAPVHLVRMAIRAKVWSVKGGLVDDVSSEMENGDVRGGRHRSKA
ncbi:hypothetical protein LguiB_026532 [Lonicera macranthoides]